MSSERSVRDVSGPDPKRSGAEGGDEPLAVELPVVAETASQDGRVRIVDAANEFISEMRTLNHKKRTGSGVRSSNRKRNQPTAFTRLYPSSISTHARSLASSRARTPRARWR